MPRLFSAFLLACMLGLMGLAVPARAQVVTPPKVLVLYDTSGADGVLGRLYVQHVQNLLTHFDVAVTLKPVERYLSKEMSAYKTVFYLATGVSNPLPAAFITDVLANTTVTVCWIGNNLDRVALTQGGYNTTFETKFGFRYLDDVEGRYGAFRYKNTVLWAEPYALSVARMGILDYNKTTVRATAFDPVTNTDEIPYVIQSGKFWYIADNPFVAEDGNNDRTLIFSDILHDILGINHPVLHRAVVRIEDVNPTSDPAALRKIADTMWSLKCPFLISLIPEWRDPQGLYFEGTIRKLRLDQAPEVAAAVRYMVARGGQVLMHGYTHQLEAVINPINMLTGTDYEFVLVRENPDKSQDVLGPVPMDSAAWCDNRLKTGLTILANCGLKPVGWLTPHYMASPVDYRVIAQRFPFAVERGFFYANGPGGRLHYSMQTFPYVVRDVYGLKHIPETVGYYNPTGTPPNLPGNIIADAETNLVVRDGWAGCFFHWFMDPAYLTQIVTGIRGKGYTFVALSAGIR